MSISYTWTITQMECNPNVAGEPDYVVTVHWTASGTDGTFFGSVYNTTSYAVKSDNPDFTPYAHAMDQALIEVFFVHRNKTNILFLLDLLFFVRKYLKTTLFKG